MKTFIATIIGKPNVGKSTLINNLLKKHISIVSNKPQTTRNNIKALYQENDFQLIIIDTPGYHKPKNKLDMFLNSQVRQSFKEADGYFFLFDASRPINSEDFELFEKMNTFPKKEVFYILNKVDLVSKEEKEERIKEIKSNFGVETLIEISAINSNDISKLIELVKQHYDGDNYHIKADNGVLQSEANNTFRTGALFADASHNPMKTNVPDSIGILDYKLLQDGKVGEYILKNGKVSKADVGITIAKDKEQQIPIIYLFHKHEAFPKDQKGNIGYLAVNYISSMISQMLNNRLNELVQKPNPPFIQAGVDDGDYLVAKTKGAFTGVAVAKEDGIVGATETLAREIERVRQFGFTAGEYSRAKADYLRALESAYNERNKTRSESYVKEYVRHFIDNEPIPGIENEYAIMNQLAPNIPIEAINQTVKQMIGEKNIVLGVFCPDKENIKYPTEAELKAALDKVKAEKLEAYVDKVSNEPLMKEKPQGGKVVKSEQGAFGSKILTLSNGVRVILKSTDFKADEIQMRAFSVGGNSLFKDEDYLQYALLDQIVDLGGLGNFNTIDLDKVLSGKRAFVAPSVWSLGEGMTGACSPKDLETELQLVYLRFTAPRQDKDAFASFIARTKASMANREADPNSALSDTISVALYNHHPRAITLKPEMLDKINYDKVIDLYKDRFADASDFTFVFVGNIDEKTATPLIEQYLGALPNLGRKENYRDVKMDIRKGIYNNDFERKMETAKSTVLMVAHGDVAYNHKNVLMMNIMGQLLDILYTQTVREEAGGTYGVSCIGSVSGMPKPEGSFQIIFETDPAKRPEMVKLIRQGIDQFIKDGPKAEDLAKVKEYMMKTYQQNQKENSYWNNALYNYYWSNLDTCTNYQETLNSITLKDLIKFAKNFFGQKNMIEVSMNAPVAKK